MPRWLRWIASWSGVWAFWLVVTRNAHPTMAHALAVTTSLVVAYAVASALNQFVFVPRYWSTARAMYWMWLVGAMLVLTGIALAIIRAAYFAWSGPDADPYGVYKHFVIDLVGMGVHLGASVSPGRVVDRIGSGKKARQIRARGQ